jgi:tetratricopeptide (TPR) repeat protein
VLLRPALLTLLFALVGFAPIPSRVSAQAPASDPDLLRRREARMVRELARGRALMEANQPSLAQRHFEDALRANPSAPEPYLELARALSALGRHADAVLLLEAGNRRAPDDVSLLSALAGALVASRREPAALQLLREAGGRQRERYDLQLQRGALAQAMGAWSEAADAFSAVLDLADQGHPVPAERVEHARASLRALGILLADLHPRARPCELAGAPASARWTRALGACR